MHAGAPTLLVADLAAASCAMLTRPLLHGAALEVACASDAALLIGAFARAPATAASVPVVRRGSGGPSIRVAPATVRVALVLSHAGALVPCEPARIVNRYVRPLLRALSQLGAPAAYFDRDWVAVKHRPVAWVGFAHDASTGRAAFEAFVSVRTPMDDREAFRGKVPGALEEILERTLDVDDLMDRIMRAYHDAYGVSVNPTHVTSGDAPHVARDVAWAATALAPIGEVGAGVDASGRFRIGGDLMVSADAIARLEREIERLDVRASRGDIVACVKQHLGGRDVALVGASLDGIADVVFAARNPT